MPARLPNKGIYATSKGEYNTKKKTFTGKGAAPSGSTKVAEPSYDEVPTVTVSSSGKVTSSGYSSQKAARADRKRAEARTRRKRAVALTKTPRAEKASQSVTPQPVLKQAKAKATAVKAPKSKPVKFEGKPTAGTPTLKELRTGSKSETLKVNKKGYVTTAPVRKAVRQVKKFQKKARKSSAPLPGLSPAASQNARVVLRRGEKRGATRKEKLAATETGLVESHFENLPYGDADSEGWRQERTSQYGTGPTGPRNVRASAERFYDESISDTGGTRGRGMTAGQLAQTIQGSAYPERYDEVAGQAKAILAAHNSGSPKPADRKKLVKAKTEAKKLGLSIGKEAKGKVTKQQMTRFKAAQVAAKELNKAKLPYVWGGGHNAGKVQVGSGVDCSGAVSYVLQKMGVPLPGGVVSGEMGSYLKPGPGAVTVFYNPTHTFMRIGNKYFGTSSANPGGGAGFIPTSVAGPEASSGSYSVGHVSGLGKKVAVALGVPPTGSSSFPGMTLSSAGTTATINSGAGATMGKPGFSSKPIKLTPAQKARRKLKKLDDLKVGQGTPTTQTKESAPSTSVLEALEAKYGAAA